MARASDFQGSMSKAEFVHFFMASDLIANTMPPSLYDFVLMFEMLDTEHSGMITARNLRQFMETAERIRVAKFDTKLYEQQLNSQGITKQFDEVEVEIQDLVAEFDLTGDRLISPEEFYNIIMAYYD
mmetsp:Transcript_44869/g.43454  ORF Transcript_44869/g.43454 Transcript_44869/m.43454 type:complete len:127 (-) Transcript_44869:37-417(-)